MPGSFYHRLQQLLISHSSQRSISELQQALKKLGEDKEPTDEFEYHLFTLTILIHEIEKEAKKQGLITLEEIEIPAPKG